VRRRRREIASLRFGGGVRTGDRLADEVGIWTVVSIGSSVDLVGGSGLDFPFPSPFSAPPKGVITGPTCKIRHF